MATAEQLKALLESFAKRDDARFRTVAIQIAAHAARQGKTKLADELRVLVDEAARARESSLGPARPVAIARPPRDLAELVVASYPTTRLSEMVLGDGIQDELARVVTEYRSREKLRARDLSPRLRILLVGPPGCGKTMTAAALAGECHLPLLSVQLHALITKFMGETASKLHLIFEAMQRTKGVYLFDEFDAIGSQRVAHNDVGEIRRVLNSFLKLIEHHESDSLIVAASNLLPLLDPALFRRFDTVLQYELPTDDMVRPLVENRLSMFETSKIDWLAVTARAHGLSHADIVRAAEEAAKDVVLGDLPAVRTEDIVRSLHHLHARRVRQHGG